MKCGLYYEVFIKLKRICSAISKSFDLTSTTALFNSKNYS